MAKAMGLFRPAQTRADVSPHLRLPATRQGYRLRDRSAVLAKWLRARAATKPCTISLNGTSFRYLTDTLQRAEQTGVTPP